MLLKGWDFGGWILFYFIFLVYGKKKKKEKAYEPDVSSQITAAWLGCMYKTGIGLL